MLVSNNIIQGEAFLKSSSYISEGTYSEINLFSQKSYTISDFIKLDWIESNKAQYINTEYYPSATTRVVADIQFTDLTVQQRIFCAGVSGDGGLRYDAYINGVGNWAFAYQNNEGNWINTQVVANMSRHTFDLNGYDKTYKIDDGATVNMSLSSYNATNTAKAPLLFVGEHTASAITDLASAKIYGYKIYENRNDLVRDFIPVKNKLTNEVGLYDLVQNKFYPSNKNSFIAGGVSEYTQVNYVKTMGTRYVDTNLKANTNFAIELKAYTSTSTSTYGGTPGFFNMTSQFTTEQYNYCYQDGYNNPNNQKIGASSTNDPDPTIFKQTKDAVYKNGVKVGSFVPTEWKDTNTLFLFGRNRNGVLDDSGTTKIYWCKIWDGDVLVRNFIPVKRNDNTVGLLDLVENKFYTIEGSEAYSVGNLAGIPLKLTGDMKTLNPNYTGYSIININDFANIRQNINYNVSIEGQGYTIAKHPTDSELYIISFNNDSITNGTLKISYKDTIIVVPIVNEEVGV